VTLLSARSLSYTYPGPVRAVERVDFQLASDELVVVCGPNGSGKSTLLRLLGGLLTPQQGEVTVDGAPIASLSLAERARRVSRVPQALASVPHLSVGDFAMAGRYAHIDRWRGPRDVDRRAVSTALEATDVGDLGERPMSALSGGQRQRALLARALASEAEVLLVDEPTTGLDPQHQVRVMQLIRAQAAEGRAAVVVTHDLNLASQFATRVLLMDDGRAVTEGTPAEVMRPEALVPVYGDQLHFGSMPPPDNRPFVLPWVTDGEAGHADGSP